MEGVRAFLLIACDAGFKSESALADSDVKVLKFIAEINMLTGLHEKRFSVSS